MRTAATFRNGRAFYLDDSRDEPLHELMLLRDDQGDVYVGVWPSGHRTGPCVRLCSSGGADNVPGLLQAMRAAHDAIQAAADSGKSTSVFPSRRVVADEPFDLPPTCTNGHPECVKVGDHDVIDCDLG